MINSFESWKQNLVYVLILDKNFALGATGSKQSKDNPNRGYTDGVDAVGDNALARQTAIHKAVTLKLI